MTEYIKKLILLNQAREKLMLTAPPGPAYFKCINGLNQINGDEYIAWQKEIQKIEDYIVLTLKDVAREFGYKLEK